MQLLGPSSVTLQRSPVPTLPVLSPALRGRRFHGPAARVQPGGARDHRVPVHWRAGHLPPRLPCHLLLLPDLQWQHPDLHREPV